MMTPPALDAGANATVAAANAYLIRIFIPALPSFAGILTTQ